ncbi:flavoprotein [Kitasatospora purpeofusca]|uniref:flavoprotein n=1 Tax=Kitasatospora purpeofusca TaxID=67352 RepID=UPI003648CE44
MSGQQTAASAFAHETGTANAREPGVSRLLLVATGSTSAADLPYWISWLRDCRPQLELTVVVTRSAERFVTRAALAGRTGGEVLEDTWPQDVGSARHVQLSEWAEAIMVYPATLHFLARLALGMGDSPALLAAQCTTAPVGLAPALPPGGMDSAAYRSHWAALAARANVVVAPPGPGISVTTGRADAWVPAPLPDLLELVERRRAELAAAPGPGAPLSMPSALADGAGA